MGEWLNIPEEIRNHLHEAALREDELRGFGVTHERIKKDHAKKFGARTASLALKYKNEYPLPPEQIDNSDELNDMQRWAQDFQRRANADNKPGKDPEPDWRERQFKDD